MAAKMPGKYFPKPMTVNTTTQIHRILKSLLAELQSSDQLHMLDQKTLTQETLINLAWIGMDHVRRRYGLDVLEKVLAPAMDELSLIVAAGMRRPRDKRRADELRTVKPPDVELESSDWTKSEPTTPPDGQDGRAGQGDHSGNAPMAG